MTELRKDDLEYSKRIENKLSNLENDYIKSQMKTADQFRQFKKLEQKFEQNSIVDSSDNEDDDSNKSLK